MSDRRAQRLLATVLLALGLLGTAWSLVEPIGDASLAFPLSAAGGIVALVALRPDTPRRPGR